MSREKITTTELTPELWPDVARLFGERGACGGCWCMAWRLAGRQWEDGKGAANRRKLQRLVKSSRALGILAYADGEPVGWCSFGPRLDFKRLETARSLRCDDAERVWSITCFFVEKEYRGRGVARHLLDHAVRAIRAAGGKIAEGYPVQQTKDGKPLPGAFAWTGTLSLFRRAGFEPVGNQGGSKERWRRRLRATTRPSGRGRARRS